MARAPRRVPAPPRDVPGPADRPRAEVPCVGRTALLTRLVAAVDAGRWPSAMLLTGGVGVGKQRVALEMARALLCEARTPAGGCGHCAACRLALTLGHPDLHWIVPHTRVGGGSLDAQCDGVLAAQAAALADRRAAAGHLGANAGDGYYVATVAYLRRLALATPAMGPRVVLVLGEADRLIAADGLPGEAANALLKLLEEPPARTVFLLTASAPHRLPATIRSRVVTVPVPGLDPPSLATVLATLRPAWSAADQAQSVAQAAGSVRAALEWGDPTWQRDHAQAMQWCLAQASGDAVACARAVRAQGSAEARGTFSTTLHLAERLTVHAAEWAVRGAPDATASPAWADLWRSWSDTPPSRWLARARAWQRAYAAAQRLGHPPLVLHRALRG